MGKLEAAVEHALDSEDIPRAVEGLETAAQLDAFMRAYNVNDGFAPVVAVVAHPLCDEGTALYAYWQFHEVLGGLDEPDELSPPSDWDYEPVLALLHRRFAQRDFATAQFHFDPIAYLELDEAACASFVESGVDPQRLKSVGTPR